MSIYAALPHIKNRQILSVSLPNAANISFNYYYVLMFIMLTYIPSKYFAFSHPTVLSNLSQIVLNNNLLFKQIIQ